MKIIKRLKRYIKAVMGEYEIEVVDYGYKRQAPVAVRVSGTRLGECQNAFGEPCYFYKSDEANNIDSGLQLAKTIVESQRVK